jgi:transposase
VIPANWKKFSTRREKRRWILAIARLSKRRSPAKKWTVFFRVWTTLWEQKSKLLHGDLMTLDETQRKKVAGWIADGMKLSEIQNRLASDLGVRMTYMDVRLLVDDLKLTPKDIDPPKPVVPVAAPAAAPAASPPQKPGAGLKVEDAPAPESSVSGVSVVVDQLARPGAVVSGKVTFSDGKKADWYIDQTGRLGLAPQEAGYRPPAADVQQFQVALEAELSKMGM